LKVIAHMRIGKTCLLNERHPDRKVSNRLKGMCSKWFDTDDRYAVKKVRKVGLQEKIHIQGKSGRKTDSNKADRNASNKAILVIDSRVYSST
jgi:hypothetical protein